VASICSVLSVGGAFAFLMIGRRHIGRR
jgi:hypothetical protein